MSTNQKIELQREIGYTAGLVWAHLRESGETTLAKLKKAVKPGEGTVEMGLGWLAREGKLKMERNGRSVKIALR